MNIRPDFVAPFLLSAMISLVLCQPAAAESPQPTGPSSPRTSVRPKSTLRPKTNPRTTLQEAVQRELKELLGMHSKKPVSASRAKASPPRQARPVQQTARSVGSNVPQQFRSYNRPPVVRRPAPKTRPTITKKRASGSLFSKFSQNRARATTPTEPAKPAIRRTNGEAPKKLTESKAPANEYTLKHLKELYEKAGIEMPSMDMSDLPKTTEAARQATAKRDLQRKVVKGGPPRNVGRRKRPNLLQRIFGLGGDKKTASRPGRQPSVRPLSPGRIPAKRGANRNLAGPRRGAGSQPPRLLPGHIKQPVVQNVRPASKETRPEDSQKDSLGNPFPELSESQADQQLPAAPKSGNPFTGLELNEEELPKPLAKTGRTTSTSSKSTTKSDTPKESPGFVPPAPDEPNVAKSQSLPDPFPELSEAEADAAAADANTESKSSKTAAADTNTGSKSSEPATADAKQATESAIVQDQPKAAPDAAAQPADADKPENSTKDETPIVAEKEEKAEKEDKPIRKTPSKHQDKMQRIAARSSLNGFKGFCPVALRDDRSLVDSRPDFSATYEGHTYFFSTAEAKIKFNESPVKYAPAHGGNDVVLSTEDKSVPGKLDYAVWFKDRLYLFSSRDSKNTFVLDPAEFAATAEN